MMPDLRPSDISLFEGLSAPAIAAVALVYFVAFSIRGVIGFGSAMPAVLFSSWILDPHHGVLSAPTTGRRRAGSAHGIRHGDWQVARPLMIARLPSSSASGSSARSPMHGSTGYSRSSCC